MTKRARIGTPEKGKCWDFKNLQKRLSEDLDGKIKGMMNVVGELKPLNAKDFRDALTDIFGKFVVPILEDQGSLMSDLIEGISCLEDKVQELREDKAKDAERIVMLEKCRESVELKVSRKEMTERVTVASKQFKIMDIDFGKEVTERKELLTAAREKLASKVRSDKRGRYEELIKHASMQVLARSTTKRKDQKSDQEIWTAPILLSLDDRESRWELEDLMRGSNLFPTFHWNREMVGLVKEMRTSLKEKFPEDRYYIRIRPEEREGKWRIKADTKRRGEESARFKLGATWEVPPMCPEVRKQNPDWVRPSWAQVAGASRDPAPSGTGEAEGMDL
jgi:hypothetical protein